jgi:hypothetical protein
MSKKKKDTDEEYDIDSESDSSDSEISEETEITDEKTQSEEEEDDEGDYYSENINEDNHNSQEIPKDERITRNKLTKYEMVRILGERQKQLTMGAKPLIKNHAGLSYDIIAEEELKLNMIPFKIKRPLPNGKYEIWTLDELDKEHLLSLLY